MAESTSGGDFLDKKSNLNKSVQDLPKLSDILVVDDCNLDLKRLRATLHLMYGYEISIRESNTLSSAIDEVIKATPQLIMLDDHLNLSSDRAHDSIPYLRHTGYEGPIIVVSGLATRKRRAELMEAGAAEVLHKDDLDSVRINEVLPDIMRNVGFYKKDDAE
ncbi:MAG: response regulator [Filomicrobium sp.]